ncbi:acyl-CoA thioesterase [Algibacter luteus]|jgi:acyl-CoA thioester hydrolase|uniref:acyl-CoA thioesterase n=1 Tax=Algibacter luteus TaxID=1178825 RepID=UPI002592C6C1|nr:thioesterase family protein [Algibacter luteus]WJJ95270.1 thioesterase [Algibacter luteus]
MTIYESTLVVNKDYIDDLNHVNNVHYVQWVQDVAKAHWQSKASIDLQTKYSWFLLSHFIEYKSAAFLNDTINLKTYIAQAEGVKYTRIVEIYNANTNKLLAKSETKWCLINAKTGRPTRIPVEIVDLFD